jgi:ElaB/YqjD/DUF883 family membrane-anchored ribosome-binding protein
MAKSAKNSRADAERAVRGLQNEFEKRIDEIRIELKENGPEAVEKSLDDLKARFEDEFGEVRDTMQKAREGLDDTLEIGRSTIRERPLMAVGVAVVVGVVIGLLLNRKGRN